MADPSHREPPAGPADLHDELMRAYLSGDGAAVERVMALLAAAGDKPAPRRPTPKAA